MKPLANTLPVLFFTADNTERCSCGEMSSWELPGCNTRDFGRTRSLSLEADLAVLGLAERLGGVAERLSMSLSDSRACSGELILRDFGNNRY
jgi:hypothetical protein